MEDQEQYELVEKIEVNGAVESMAFAKVSTVIGRSHTSEFELDVASG